MNRLHCINCRATWPSLPYHELEQQHICPACGDELVPAVEGQVAPPSMAPAHLEQAA